jgi:RNA 2',3'-cyclic 3'-phosphodiesterase
MAGAGTRRIFFALWPDSRWQAALAEATRQAVLDSGGRAVPVESLHATLAFLGSVPEARLLDVRAAAIASVGVASSVHLALTRLEYWKGAAVLCAVAEENPAVAALATGLKTQLIAAGFAPDLKPFRPHVTLARKVRVARPADRRQHDGKDDPLRQQPVIWTFNQFALVDSRTCAHGPVYTVLDSFQLGG